MDLNQLANLRDFIGGVAVLVTLSCLTVQVRESRQEVQTANNQAQAESQRLLDYDPGSGEMNAPHYFLAQELSRSRTLRDAWIRIEAELHNSDLGNFAKAVAARLASEVPA